ncbi:MAG: S1 RNA-binding domain-containing protein [Oscillospiraceae bacterium]|nr:S1 RNA-binding domain-containing protein [Oscillospiraceae bacterium]
MEFTVGTVLDGKVKTITSYGAFIQLPENRTGMVHISEVSASFVSDIRKHLTEGQTVRVKIIGVDEAGRIKLSVKRAQEKPPAPKEKAPLTFEEKLKQFMSESDSKLSGSRQYEHVTKSRKR